MLASIAGYIKSLDVFGFPISINLKQSKGAAHKTTYGGIATAFIKIALLIIFGFGVRDMIHNLKYTSKSSEKLMSRDDSQAIIKYKDTGIRTMINIIDAT